MQAKRVIIDEAAIAGVSSGLWAERYRPTTLDGIVGNEHIMDMLKNLVKRRNFPNLLMAGPPGTGKTTAAMCICDALSLEYLYINASEERGIDIVRYKVIPYMSTVSLEDPSAIKVIVFDEADGVTAPAQQALRVTASQYSEVSRSIIICNNINEIIGPMQDRCLKLYFEPVSIEKVVTRLKWILRQERQFSVTDGALQELVRVAGGSVRDSINFLQGACEGSPKGMTIDEKRVRFLYHLAEQTDVFMMLRFAIDGELSKAIKVLDSILSKGTLSMKLLQDTIGNALIVSTAFSDLEKIAIYKHYGKLASLAKSYIEKVSFYSFLAYVADEGMQMRGVQ